MIPWNSHPIYSDFGQRYYDATNGPFGYSIDRSPHAIVDLSLTEEQIHTHLRKSYCSLINWGRRNLKIECWSDVTQYRDLHALVAGRQTRGDASWTAMEHFIRDSGDLTHGYLDGRLVAGTMIWYGRHWAYYASGAYHRNLHLPLGHWPLYNAILRARTHGCRWFDLGTTGYLTPKEKRIVHFKKGFATSIEPINGWKIVPLLAEAAQ